MTRDELVEQLAQWFWMARGDDPWEEASETSKGIWRECAQSFFARFVVSFVGEWLEDICDQGLYTKDEIPGVWRFTMSTEEGQ